MLESSVTYLSEPGDVLQFTYRIVDCLNSYDLTPLPSTLLTKASGDTCIDEETKFTFGYGLGYHFYIDLATTTQFDATVCGAYVYTMSVADASKASYFEIVDHILTVKADDVTEEFSTSITFSVNNDYDGTTLDTITFDIKNCVNFARAKATEQAITLDETITVSAAPGDLILDLNLELLPVTITWDAFNFPATLLDLCPIDSYKVFCTDPSGAQHETNYDGSKLSGSSTLCEDFVYSLDPSTRQITFDTPAVTNDNEGDYTFTIRGHSSDDYSIVNNVLTFTYTILANCEIELVTAIA